MTDILSNFQYQTVLVLGDLMLDEYLWGDIRRISPEAPVPVVDIHRRTQAPGGACNVAANIVALGGKVYLGGVTGNDQAAGALIAALETHKIDKSGIVSDPSRPTITKTRIIARNQQVVRYDCESRVPLDIGTQNSLLTWADAHFEQAKVCIFSDYAKGISTPEFLQRLFGLAHAHKCAVLVDPKGNNYSRYRGSTLITPNQMEAGQAVGFEIENDEDLLRCARQLRDQLPGTNILIKRGGKGMALYPMDGEEFHVPARDRQVFDVTGAGDTVIAVLAMALGAGASLPEAAHLANCAAGVVVSKVGTATVTMDELSIEFNSN